MPAPTQVLTRLNTALSAVNTTTDLDTLIALIDSGRRADLNVSVAVAELTRRANLVSAGTPEIEAAKLAAGFFKVDFPVKDLWNAQSSGGASHVLGEYAFGNLQYNTNYVPADGSRYLISAYPDLQQLVNSGQVQQIREISSNAQKPIVPILASSSTYREIDGLIDGNVIIHPSQPQPTITSIGSGRNLLAISTDGGQTWNGRLHTSIFTATLFPQVTNIGLSPTGGCGVLAVCKLSSPGHYGVMLHTGTTAGIYVYMQTVDFGVTWTGMLSIDTSSRQINTYSSRLWFRNGVLLFKDGNSNLAWYSTDNGLTWISLSAAAWTNGNSLEMALSADGWLIYCDNNTTTFYVLQWPATPAGWSSSISFTTISGRLPASCRIVTKVGAHWVAWNDSNGSRVLYVSLDRNTNFTANNLSALSGRTLTAIFDVQIKDSTMYMLVGTAEGRITLSCAIPAATVLSGVTVFSPPANVSFPTASANSNARYPIASRRFCPKAANTDLLVLRVNRDDLVGITAPSGAENAVMLYVDTPASLSGGVVRFGTRLYAAVPTINSSPNFQANNASNGDANFYLSIQYYSEDNGIRWTPIAMGFGSFVVFNGVLWRINASGLMERSSDGLVWSAAGVTQPSNYGAGTTGARLIVCNDVMYYLSEQGSTANMWGSSNPGNVAWQSIAGALSPRNIMRIRAPIVRWKGHYYLQNVYQDGGLAAINSISALNIQRSVDGLTSWSNVSTVTNMTTNHFDYRWCGWLPDRDVLNMCPCWVSSTTPQLSHSTNNGIIWNNWSAWQITSWTNSFYRDTFSCQEGYFWNYGVVTAVDGINWIQGFIFDSANNANILHRFISPTTQQSYSGLTISNDGTIAMTFLTGLHIFAPGVLSAWIRRPVRSPSTAAIDNPYMRARI
jgi:hypothetical protein